MKKKTILCTMLLACATQTTQPNIIGEGIELFYDHSGKIAALNIASFAAALIVQKAIIQPQIKKLKNKQGKQNTIKTLNIINALLYAIEAGNIIVTIPALGLLIADHLGWDTVYETERENHTTDIRGDRKSINLKSEVEVEQDKLLGRQTIKRSRFTKNQHRIIRNAGLKTKWLTLHLKGSEYAIGEVMNEKSIEEILGSLPHVDQTNKLESLKLVCCKHGVACQYKYTPRQKKKK